MNTTVIAGFSTYDRDVDFKKILSCENRDVAMNHRYVSDKTTVTL